MAKVSTALNIPISDTASEDIIKAAGDLSGYSVHGARVLLGIFERAKDGKEVKIGSLIIPEVPGGTLAEDAYQGKVCLVLKKGPIAFKDDDANKFHGDDVKVGDWVAIRPTDGWQIKIGNQKCRIVRDTDIQITVPYAEAAF